MKAAPMFREVEGLIRKQFLLDETGQVMGGAYLWKSRETAERFYEGGFRQMIAARYGAEPTITYFESPVVVDNQAGAILEG